MLYIFFASSMHVQPWVQKQRFTSLMSRMLTLALHNAPYAQCFASFLHLRLYIEDVNINSAMLYTFHVQTLFILCFALTVHYNRMYHFIAAVPYGSVHKHFTYSIHTLSCYSLYRRDQLKNIKTFKGDMVIKCSR